MKPNEYQFVETRNLPRWMKPFLITLFVWVAACRGLAAADDPSCYRHKSSWHGSLLASLEAVDGSGVEDGFAPFESNTMRGGDPARQISIPVVGAKEAYLFVTGVPDVKWAVADWADARLIRNDGSAESLTHAASFTVLLGRHEVDLTLKSGLYQKLRLNGRTFDRGLNVQADSVIRVPVEASSARFEATIGVDDWAGTNGSVRFSVLGARSAAVKRLWVPLLRDFETGRDRQQINWERADRIFEFAWRPGDWAALAQRYAQACGRVPPLAKEAARLASTVSDRPGLDRLRETCYLRSRSLAQALTTARSLDFAAPRLALEDLTSSFPRQYPATNLARFDALQQAVAGALKTLAPENLETWTALAGAVAEFETFQREALLANPWLDFDQLLVLKRIPLGGARRTSWEGFGYGEYLGIPRQSSWNYGTMPNVDKWTNEIAVLSPVRPEGKLTTFYQPPGTGLVNDIELHWDADGVEISRGAGEARAPQVHARLTPL
jgi:hypothetical protein